MIKGTTKELYIGKEEINIIDFWSNKVTLKYTDLKRIEYIFATKMRSGYILFVKRTNESNKFDFKNSANDLVLRAIDYIAEHAPDILLNEIEDISIPDNKEIFKKAKKSKGFSCPKCGSHDIDLLSTDANIKTKQETSLSLNPLKPFTVFNTKTVKKEKKSAVKIGLGIMTGGTSLLLTGTKHKAHNEYYCRNCGNKWISKK